MNKILFVLFAAPVLVFGLSKCQSETAKVSSSDEVMLPVDNAGSLVCNDGTLSPTCDSCHSGCCSRHGGC